MVLLNLTMFEVVKTPVWKYLCGILGTSSLTIFAFLITEGYRRTHNLTKYMLRVLIVAVISAFPYHAVMKLQYGDSAGVTAYFSAALSAFVCLGALSSYDRLKNKNTRIAFVCLVCIVSYFLDFYWAPYVFILTFIIHIYHDKFRYMAYYITTIYTVFFAVALVFLLSGGYSKQVELEMMIYQIGCILPLPLIARYKGEEGIKLKWIVYIFYPLMLVCFMLLLLPRNAELLPLIT